jgi:CBS domain-containing protein
MRCGDLMTSEVEVFCEADTVQHVARRMRELDVGFAPVCDRDGRPLGTLTDRDIALRVCAEDRLASRIPARDVMTRGPVTCKETDGLDVAEARMREHHKSRVMVVAADGRLVGVISLSDIAEAEDDARAAATLRGIAGRDAQPGQQAH